MREPGTGRPASGRRAGVFAVPDFRRIWTVGLIIFVVRWLEMLAIAVFVYERTGSAFLVAMVSLLRLLPLSLLGAFIGAAADRIERRTALALIALASLASSATVALLAHAGHLAIWHIAVASVVNGIGWAADNPVRRMLIGEVVGPERMGRAMSFDVGANNASRMLGPTIGGLLLAEFGIDGAFALSVALYAVALAVALGIRQRNAVASPLAGSALLRIAEGLMLIRRDRRLSGTLVITVIYNVFGWPCTSMVPVISQDRFHLGAQGVGLLASMDGVGAFVGAVVLAIVARPALYGRIYVGGVASYCALTAVFAVAPTAFLAGVALVLSGLAGAGFATMQATIVFAAAPPEMRARLLGVLTVCIGVGPIGFLHLGLLAEAIGASAATATVALEGVAVLVLTRRYWHGLGEVHA